MSSPEPPDFKDSYSQLCTSYHSIDDFRTKLLGFLPLASGVGIFAITKDPGTSNTSLIANYAGYISIFGCAITIGLALFEIYGIAKCANLIQLGSRIENRLMVVGQFNTRPEPVRGWIDEVFASGIIYTSVLSAWIFILFGGMFGHKNELDWTLGAVAALVVLMVGLVATRRYSSWLKANYKICRFDLPEKHSQPCICKGGNEICVQSNP